MQLVILAFYCERFLHMLAPMPKSKIDKSTSVLYNGQYRLEQTTGFAQWLHDLRDMVGRARILKRLRRVADGNLGDVKAIGDGVYELRMFFGPGYRVYFMFQGDALILLLAGGDKSSQERDIASAKEVARQIIDGGENNDI